jgi:peptide/nickel transport system permease protein/oligopeptide transport system permease protein
MGGLFKGDFGTSFTGRPVSEIFADAWPVTIKLGLTAFVIEIIIGLGLGLLAGLRRGGYADRAILFGTLIVIAIPTFVLGFSLQLIVGVKWKDYFHLPVAGVSDGWPKSYILPALVLAGVSLAYISRLTRTSLVENLRADYVRTAVSKGMTRRRVVGVHTLRNSLIPVITFIGYDVGALMGGAVVTERIFNINGIGGYLYRGIGLKDGSIVVGTVTCLVLIYLLVNLIVDVLYGVLDPRISHD